MKVLLVIDLQKEFYKKTDYEKVLKYVKENQNNYDLIIGTFFTNYENSNFMKALNYKECLEANFESIEYKFDYCMPKYSYGLDITELKARKITEKDSIDIIGCEIDSCIMATAFNLFDKNYPFKILSDYIYTTSKDYSREQAMKVLKRNFGDYII